MAARFHSRGGSMVSLSNGGKTAQRNHPAQEFNNGVAISADPLKDNQLFEVSIDRKVNSWSGSIEIGITACDPSNLVFPTSATGFRDGTWVMSGCSVMRDGHTILDEYGQDLDQLAEGDRVGVMRTSSGVFHIYVNGVDQGPAASGVPPRVWAVVDMYGKCAQVSVVDDSASEAAVLCHDLVTQTLNLVTSDLAAAAAAASTNTQLVFHERCGTLVKLSNGSRTAERQRPLDEFNNGVVMTSRPLHDDERFEIRIDRLVDKWSGSIEVGITTHNPNNLDFPATMTNMRSGTIMMSGSGILTNGKGTRREYGEFNLDELQEGDRIGLIRKSSGALHYFINGVDQGMATSKAPQTVWGVVDLYGMAVKVTIIDVPDDNGAVPSNDTCCRDNNIANDASILYRQLCDTLNACRELDERMSAVDPLLFHPRCGSHAAVINGQRTAHRPHAVDDFNNAVVVTNRPLHANEMFEVRLDKMVDKWAGSIEIGVTTHSPLALEFPSTMTNVRSGTWMMTGNGVMHNGMTVHEEYGLNLDRLKVGDRVGVLRKEDGTLNFYVNGVDQGPATTGVPAEVYGVIDLYGQAAQATIVDSRDALTLPEIEVSQAASTDGIPSAVSGAFELRFHQRHGKNASVSPDGRIAWRSSARGEFNEAMLASHRALRDNELFEVRVDRIVERWSGSLEVGVTIVPPDEMEFPNTMTEMDYGTWMLSGSTVMQNGVTVENSYQLDLDALRTGSRVGVMRCSDGTLHYYLDGADQGVACSNVPTGLYAIIDLYGQCAQVSIVGLEGRRGSQAAVGHSGMSVSDHTDPSTPSPFTPGVLHRFARYCGKHIALKNSSTTARRTASYDHGIVFSSTPLSADDLFEVRVDSIATHQWCGSLQIGLTSMSISGSSPFLPASATDLRTRSTWVVTRSEVRRNGAVVRENYCPSLDSLDAEDRIGVCRAADGTMHVYVNGCDMGIAASGIPKTVFAVVDVYGRVESVSISSVMAADPRQGFVEPVQLKNSANDATVAAAVAAAAAGAGHEEVESEEEPAEDDVEVSEATKDCVEFSPCLHGKNLVVGDGGRSAERIASYNQAIAVSRRPLSQGKLFKVCIGETDDRWTASLTIGIVSLPAGKWSTPISALDIHRPCWLVHADSVYCAGTKVKVHNGPNLDSLSVGHTVGLLLDTGSTLRLYVDDVDCGIVAHDINVSRCHAIVDLYGRCRQLAIVTEADPPPAAVSVPAQEQREKANKEEGRKEKHAPRPVSEQLPVPNVACDYLRMCSRFRSSLGIPDGYFNPDATCCYCEACHKLRGDAAYYRRGDPPKEYAVPVGWCKFVLRFMSKPDAQHTATFDKWHVAYHGTKPSAVRRLLDTGDLLALSAGSSLVGGSVSRSLLDHCDEKNKPEEQVLTEPVVLSPSIKYAGSVKFAPKMEYRDTKTKKPHGARVAVQLCIKPGSYKVGTAQTDDNDSDLAEAMQQIDAKFSNNELEWSTKERGSMVLCALLIRVD